MTTARLLVVEDDHVRPDHLLRRRHSV